MIGRKVWSTAAAIGMVAAGFALAQDAPRRPLSPAGVAATMVGGTWSAPDKDG